jgi:electron transfer flavoprotein beta subunit
LPAVVSVTEKINEPRFPSFKGIMAAKKKPVQSLALGDLGISGDEVGFAGATSQVLEFTKRPARTGGAKVVDEGNGGEQLVAYLATEKFV